MKLVRSISMTVLLSSLAFGQMAAPEPSKPTTVPATNPAETLAAQEALVRYNKAVTEGDIPALLASIDTTTDLQKKAMAMMGRLTAASHGLYKATLDKFGAKALETEGVTKEAFQGAFPALPLDQIKITVKGDTAALATIQDDQPLPFSLVKKDGVWKLDAGFLPPFTEKQLNDQSQVLDGVIGAIDATAKDVAAGVIKSPDEAVLLMQHRAQKSMRAVQLKQMEEAMKGAATQPGSAKPQIPNDILVPQ